MSKPQTIKSIAVKPPLTSYVTLFYHLQDAGQSEGEVEILVNQELEGKRRDVILYTLATRLFKLKRDAFLKSIGVKSHA